MSRTLPEVVRRSRQVAWFIRRPHLYRELGRRVGRVLRREGAREMATHRTDDAIREVEEWCASRAVDTATALEQLLGRRPPPFTDLFRAEIEAAREAAASAPEMGGPGDLDLIYHLAEHAEARRVVETGVAYGWSTLALLLSMRNRDEGTLVSTDLPYLGRGNDDFVGIVVPQALRERWTLVRLPDKDGLPRALGAFDGPLDLCHYDSDKSYEGRLWGYDRLWNALRPGGLLISDDISDNGAFRDFCARQGQTPIVVRTEALPGFARVSSREDDRDKFVGILRR